MKPFSTSLIWLLFPAALSVNYLSAQSADPVVFRIGEGDVLVYDVRDKGDLYYYIITIKEYKSKITFDWEMTEPVQRKGSVEIKPKAFNSSMVLINRMKEDLLVCEDRTLIWLSKSLFKEIVAGNMPDVTFDDDAGNKMSMTGNGKQTIKYKGKPMEVDVIETSNNQSFFDLKKMSILNSDDNPLITRLNIGFTVELVEVR